MENQNLLIIIGILFICCCCCLSSLSCLSSSSSGLLLILNNNSGIESYDYYPNVYEFGDFPSDFQNTESINSPTNNGCVTNITLDDAATLCDEASDCNAFYSNGSGQVCFKNNVNPQLAPKSIDGDNDDGMYVKKN